MDIVLERGIVKCFPENEVVQSFVRDELINPKNFSDERKVHTLIFMAIKSYMRKELTADKTDIFSKSIYCLIFKRYLYDWKDVYSRIPLLNATTPDQFECQSEFLSDWDDIIESEPIWKAASTSDQLPGETDEDYIRKTQIRRVYTDGPIMFSIFCQWTSQYLHHGFDITLNQNNVLIKMRGYYYMAEIPHRDGLDFDTYWTRNFVKMLLSKYVGDVVINMKGKGLPADKLNDDYMADYINRLIVDKLPRVNPRGGYERIVNKKWPVYRKSYDESTSVENCNYAVKFLRCNSIRDGWGETGYWGYLPKEYK